MNHVEREIAVLKSLIAILDAHKRGKRKYEKRKEQIVVLAALGLLVTAIAKKVGMPPYYVKNTIARSNRSNLFRVHGSGPMHDRVTEEHHRPHR